MPRVPGAPAGLCARCNLKRVQCEHASRFASGKCRQAETDVSTEQAETAAAAAAMGTWGLAVWPPVWLLCRWLVFALRMLPAVQAQLPLPIAVQFSWERVQPFFHEDNVTGPYSDEAIQALARFPLITLEKWHGACEGWEAANESDHCPSISRSSYPCCEEDRITSDLRRVKTLNPNTTTVM